MDWQLNVRSELKTVVGLVNNEVKLPILYPKLIDLIMGRLIGNLRTELVTVALV